MEWWYWLVMAVVLGAVVYYMFPKLTPKPTGCSSCPGKQSSS